MVCNTRSSYRQLRSSAAAKKVQLLPISCRRKVRRRKVRSLSPQRLERDDASYRVIENLVIAPEYEWVRTVYMKYGPEAMGLLLEMTQPDLDKVLWIP